MGCELSTPSPPALSFSSSPFSLFNFLFCPALSFQSLAHSFARSNFASLLFSISSALFAQNTRGVYPSRWNSAFPYRSGCAVRGSAPRQIVRCAGLADCAKIKLPAEAGNVPKRQPAGGSLQFRGNGLLELEKEGQMS